MAAMLMSALNSSLTPPVHAEETAVKQTPWSVDFAGPRGVSVAYKNVPIIRRSSLYVVKPGWSGLLYDQRAQKHDVLKQEDGSLRVTGIDEEFRAEYELRPIDAQSFELRFRGELTKDVPAEIEFAAGYFNANLIANRPFRAEVSGTKTGGAVENNAVEPTTANSSSSTLSGIVPAFPVGDTLPKNDLAPNFQSLEFDSRLGRLRLQVTSTTRVTFSDARRDTQAWAKEAPVFWCGWMAGTHPLRFGQPVEMVLRIHIEPLDNDKRAEAASNISQRDEVSLRPIITSMPDAISTRERPLHVVPRPQKMQVTADRHFVLRPGTKWSIKAPSGETRLTAAVQRLLRDEWAVPLAAPHATASTQDGWCGIRLGDAKPVTIPAGAKPQWAQHPDAYRITVAQSGIEIVAPTARGVFYGLQTLAQLLRPANKSVQVQWVQIEDWPILQFRGAHWFPSQSGVPFHKQLISVMARHKMNYAVIQCEAARWDSHPEIAAPNSVSKRDLRELVKWCRENFIEPIPLINVPGHAEWMFRNKQNLDLAEDPQTPYAYAVNNPKSLAFVREILTEALEVFQPKIFHLGHDEVTMRGRFPNPENPFYRQGVTATDLVMSNLSTLHGWLAARGVQTMVWGDMFLHKSEGMDAAHAPNVEEAKKRRSLLPKNVIVADWHYGAGEKYPSLGLFAKEGVKTVSATWNLPQNIRHFTRATIDAKSWGVLQTTWAGYFPDATTLDTELQQYTGFILAADYSWSGRGEAPSELPYDVAAQWNHAYMPQKGGEGSGALLDLSPSARVTPENWLGLGPGWDLSKFFVANDKSKARRFDDVLFRTPPQHLIALSAGPAALAPASASGALNLQVNRTASQVALLHSTLWSVPNGLTAARLTAEYTDGTQFEFDIITGRSITSWQGDAVAANARRGWSGMSPASTPVGLRVTRWKNPHPQKTISRLRFKPIDSEAGYALLE
jgi:hypothetical protein